MQKTRAFIPVLFGLMLLAGCASAPKGVPLTPDMTRVWPLPPDQARVAWLHQIQEPGDVGIAPKGLRRLFSVFSGKARAPHIEEPIGIYADADGWLMVADTGLQVVHLYNLEARTYAQAFQIPDGRLASPVGVAYDPETGRVFVADSIRNHIYVYDTGGTYVGYFGEGLRRVSGLFWDAREKRLLAADTGNHRVLVFNGSGEQIQSIGTRGDGPGQFNFPTHVTVDGDGRMIVTDTLNFRVQVLSRTGEPVRQVGRLGRWLGNFSKPKGVAVNDAGQLFVVDGIFDVVQLFDGEGQLLMHFGGTGPQPGRFWLPAGIAVAGNDIFIADTHNKRVQMFRMLDVAPEQEEIQKAGDS